MKDMKMRREDKRLSLEDSLKVLDRNTNGVLSLVSENGYPYGVPLSFGRNGNTLYFHGSSGDSHKVAAIRNCSKASFTVVDKDEIIPSKFETYYRSAIAFGKVRIIEDGAEIERAMESLIEKYSHDFLESGRKYMQAAKSKFLAIAFDIETLSGKSYNGRLDDE